MSGQEPIIETPGGFIQGADAPQHRMTAAEWQAMQNQTSGQPITINVPGQQGNGQTFTAEDIARARQEEKDKLYGRIEEMDAQLKTLAEERSAREAAEQAVAEAQAEAEKARHDAETDVRQLLVEQDQAWQQRFAALEQDRERERALREQEARFAAVNEYRRDRIEQEAEFIIPQLRDLIQGATEEQIEQSIDLMKQRSAQIFADVQGAQAQMRQQMRGAAVTAPPVGPMEQATTLETLTPDQIRDMDMVTYGKYRESLLKQTGGRLR